MNNQGRVRQRILTRGVGPVMPPTRGTVPFLVTRQDDISSAWPATRDASDHARSSENGARRVRRGSAIRNPMP
eukprot:5584793-Pyramimonas_sp.AAC.1